MSRENGKPKVECLRPCEVARVLGVSTKLVLRLLREKVLPGFKVGRVWLIRRTDLEEYLSKLVADTRIKNDKNSA